MPDVTHLVLGWSAVASAYQVAQWAAARGFVRAPQAPTTTALPPVTVLKPLKGLGFELATNLETFCTQDYPEHQIVFGVEDPDDPAVDVVRALAHRHPDRDIVLSVGAEEGANRKVATLARMMREARHGVLVLSDADIRVRPDYLRSLVAPLGDPAVGLVTCLYRGRPDRGVAALVESLFINTDFLPMVLMAQWVQPMRYAYGASMAFRRAALDSIGGFPALRDHLADDYQLGHRIADRGWTLRLLPTVVETVIDAKSMRDVWRHQLRWARTYRVCQPVNWFATIVAVHTMLAGVAALVVTGGSATGWLAFGAALACRLGSLRAILGLLGDRETQRHLWLVPAKDLAWSAIWAASWLGRDVEWSGQRLRVLSDGRMVPLPSVEPALAPGPASPSG